MLKIQTADGEQPRIQQHQEAAKPLSWSERRKVFTPRPRGGITYGTMLGLPGRDRKQKGEADTMGDPTRGQQLGRNYLASHLPLSSFLPGPPLGKLARHKLTWIPRKCCLQRRGEKRDTNTEPSAKNWHEKDLRFSQKKELDLFIWCMVQGFSELQEIIDLAKESASLL